MRTTTTLTTGGIVRTVLPSSSRKSLHFFPAFVGKFCLSRAVSKVFVSWPFQPPRSLPTPSNFIESAIYFLSSSDFVSHRIISNIFSASSFFMDRRTYGCFSCGDKKPAAATDSMISTNKVSILYPKEFLLNFGKSL